MSEKLCLKWTDFQENARTAFGILRNDQELADVTLVSEDGQQVEAHKIILAASSPFFNEMLRMNKHPHPLIYMRGVNSDNLLAIIDFLYFGEANVYHENFDAFMALAEELNLKGLSKSENKEEKGQPCVPSISRDKTNIPKVDNRILFENVDAKVEEEAKANLTEIGTIRPSSTKHDVNNTVIEDLDAIVRTMMTKSGNKSTSGARAQTCSVCGKEGQTNAIKDHIEAKHLHGVSIPCKYCAKIFR